MNLDRLNDLGVAIALVAMAVLLVALAERVRRLEVFQTRLHAASR